MNYTIVSDLGVVKDFLSNANFIGLDSETTSLEPQDGKLRLIQLTDGKDIFIIDCFKFDKNELRDSLLRLEDVDLKKTVQNCLAPNTLIHFADGRKLPLSKVVNQKISGEVVCIDENTGQLTTARIIDWINGGIRDWDDWVRIKTRGKEEVRVTKDHQILTYRGRVAAGDIKIGDRIATGLNELTSVQRDLLYGTLLGDGSLSLQKTASPKSPYFKVSHCVQQEGYISLKKTVLSNMASRYVAEKKTFKGFSKNGTQLISLSTRSDCRLFEFLDNCIVDGRKDFTDKWCSNLSDAALAIWYCDDGHLDVSSASFCISKFSKEGTNRLVAYLQSRGFPVKLYVRKDGHVYLYIRGDRNVKGARGMCDGLKLFWESISKYVPTSMSWKLPEKYRHLASDDYWTIKDKSNMSFYTEVVNISKIYRSDGDVARYAGYKRRGKGLAQYCLTMEPHHNFLAGGLIVSNCKFELKWFKYHLDIKLNSFFDTYLASKLLDFDADADLGSIIERYLDIKVDKSEQLSNWGGELTDSQLDYAATDVLHLLPLREKMLDELKRLNLIEAAKLEFNCVPAVANMELAGFPVNRERFTAFIEKTEKERDEALLKLEHFLMSAGGKQDYEKAYVVDLFGEVQQVKNEDSVNLRSQQQLIKKFKDAGIDIDSTDKKLIAVYAQTQPDLKLLMDFREKEKLASTYGQEFLNKNVRPDNRIYANFLQIGARTYRFASRNPNLQNAAGKDFRKIFTAPEGKKFVISDMAQFELRILGSFSNDDIMLDAFNHDKDLHSVTTANIFGIRYEDAKLPENKHKRLASKICFSGDTELLTKNGWVRFDRYDGVADVLQFELPADISYNPPLPKSNRWGHPTGKQIWDGSGIVSFVKPIDFKSFENERLYNQVDRNLDLLMTADHQVIFMDGNDRARKMAAKDVNKNNISYIPAAGYFAYDSLALTDLETRFLAMTVSDGSFSPSKTLRFGFHKERKIIRCESLLKSLDIKYSKVNTNYNNYSVTNFTVRYSENSVLLDKLLLVINLKKELSTACITDIDGFIYLDEAAYWDGHQLNNKTSRRRVVFTSINRNNIDVMQIMCCMNGIQSKVKFGNIYSSISYRMPTKPYFEGKHCLRGSWNLQDSGFNDRVYCVQVPSGAFFVRRNGKVAVTGNCNFAIAYGIGGEGLALRLKGEGLDFNPESAQQLIDDWYSAYPKAGKWLKNQRYLVANAKKRYHLKDGQRGFCDLRGMDGRLLNPKFFVGDLSSEAGAKRDCQNFPIQCANAIAIKRALVNLDKELAEKFPSARIVNCIHDEIVVEVDEKDADEVCSIVKRCMEEGGSYYMKNVKIEADAKVCSDWSEK